jgi:hypothetical protein
MVDEGSEVVLSAYGVTVQVVVEEALAHMSRGGCQQVRDVSPVADGVALRLGGQHAHLEPRGLDLVTGVLHSPGDHAVPAPRQDRAEPRGRDEVPRVGGVHDRDRGHSSGWIRTTDLTIMSRAL